MSHWTEAALSDLRAVEAYIARHSPQYYDITSPPRQHGLLPGGGLVGK